MLYVPSESRHQPERELNESSSLQTLESDRGCLSGKPAPDLAATMFLHREGYLFFSLWYVRNNRVVIQIEDNVNGN